MIMIIIHDGDDDNDNNSDNNNSNDNNNNDNNNNNINKTTAAIIKKIAKVAKASMHTYSFSIHAAIDDACYIARCFCRPQIIVHCNTVAR